MLSPGLAVELLAAAGSNAAERPTSRSCPSPPQLLDTKWGAGQFRRHLSRLLSGGSGAGQAAIGPGGLLTAGAGSGGTNDRMPASPASELLLDFACTTTSNDDPWVLAELQKSGAGATGAVALQGGKVQGEVSAQQPTLACILAWPLGSRCPTWDALPHTLGPGSGVGWVHSPSHSGRPPPRWRLAPAAASPPSTPSHPRWACCGGLEGEGLVAVVAAAAARPGLASARLCRTQRVHALSLCPSYYVG